MVPEDAEGGGGKGGPLDGVPRPLEESAGFGGGGGGVDLSYWKPPCAPPGYDDTGVPEYDIVHAMDIGKLSKVKETGHAMLLA